MKAVMLNITIEFLIWLKLNLFDIVMINRTSYITKIQLHALSINRIEILYLLIF